MAYVPQNWSTYVGRGFQAMVERAGKAAGFDMKIHPSHVAPRLRIQVGQRRCRHQNDPGLSRPQVDPAYGALHRAGADSVQKLIPGLTAPRSGFEIKKGDPSFSNSKKLKYLSH
jgi:hypothetical protein